MKTEPTEACKMIEESWYAIPYMGVDYEQNPDIVIDKGDVYEIVEKAFQEGQSNPKIKQLEWENIDMWYFKAKTSLGLGYSITEIKDTYIVHFGGAPISWEKSLESAAAAAQRDFEKRIKKCLE